MKCLRCGYCCHFYLVTIVDDPMQGINKDNLVVHEGKGLPCKHLEGKEIGKYKCKIHNKEWYKETPCFDFEQVGNEESDCRIGEYVIKNFQILKDIISNIE